MQAAAGHFQVGQPRAAVLGDLEHPRAERLRRGGLARVAAQRGKQRVDAVQPQRRAEQAGEHLPPGDGRDDIFLPRVRARKHLLHQRFAGHGQRLGAGGGGHIGAKVHTAVAKAGAQLAQAHGAVRPGQVHLVDEHKRRHAVALQQPPQRLGVGLHAVGARNDKDRIVKHLQRALGFGGKIDMPGRVQQREHRLLPARPGRGGQRQHRLLGKDRDAARAFLRVGVEKSVPVVDTPQPPQRARAVEHRLRQRRLAAVNMGEDARANALDAAALPGLFAHNKSPLLRVNIPQPV